ncbi:hypothetical protein KHA90_14340 [Flavobacterium psychroterrae]|uniref:Uncharacterized protein n=1 Tax=Flavobacterium psychroterrae TaxID=2133767 RepID=A0ABS5PET0_9FLAO|nr:hypothetical protein [Flavobacterium psychroterrae]MBS7232206.1 hypothetical protein [Flavobacterium psychroterrae]
MINSDDQNHINKDQINEEQIERNLDELEYPASEDIYTNEDKLEDIDPEGISGERIINPESNNNEWKQNSDKLGNDLDIPGSELDDEEEEIGSEDEENNFYSEGDTE